MSTLKPDVQAEVSAGKDIEHFSGFNENIMTFWARKPVIAFLIALVITVITSYGLKNLKIDTAPDSLINNSNPMLPLYQNVVKEFGSDNIILVHYQYDDILALTN